MSAAHALSEKSESHESMAGSESRAPTLLGPPAIERAERILIVTKSNLAAVLSPRYCAAMTVIVPEVSVPLFPRTRLLPSDSKTPAPA